ncbi:glycosyltransferase family 9 protein [Noviherbaspirillum aridicola]|uniref:Methyltransferase family protein n=1 Tax=Noviherbaspirillum aridicola TaxID=2849687 RepID=A0ABQ4Q5L6_9BURK|nr:glycosyltransferase family 9 protein [Noviherbaspirillum aridicola]GIZ52009.1 hypothetical protein NCCP691_20230 [Noviherbaspirillum aridicola]
MKINLGCGRDYRPGWLNVDFFDAAQPDQVVDLERTPWPLDNDCAEFILMKHVLEHLGKDTQSFLSIMSELYRIAKPDALIEIHVSHPMHADYTSDPSRVRPITPEMLQCFDLALVERWQAASLPRTPLAKYIGVDFETTAVEYFLDPYWIDRIAKGEITQEAVAQKARSEANVVQWMRIVLRARKPFRHGRSLDHLGAVCLERRGGLGDVLMLLGAAHALKAMTGKPIFLLTDPAFRDLASGCPHLEGVVTDAAEVAALHERFQHQGGMHCADLGAAKFGISGRHQIDAYLEYFGLTAPPHLKEIVLQPDADGIACTAVSALPPIAPGKKRVLVHAAQGDPNRTWPAIRWSALCERLVEDGHQVILIGDTGTIPGRGAHAISVPGTHVLVDQLSTVQTLGLMRVSDVLVTTDSGPVQLAAATSIHIVGLYSVVAPENRLPFREGRAGARSTGLKPVCADSPCYRHLLSDDALRRANTSDPARLFSHWCVAERKFACMNHEIGVDSVYGAIAHIESCPA